MYQLLQRQLEDYKTQATLIEKKLIEFEVSKNALRDMKKIKDGSEILMPVGSGIYLHGTAQPSKKALVDIGANYIVARDLNFAEDVLNAKQSEVEKMNERLATEVTELVNKINQLAVEIERLQQK